MAARTRVPSADRRRIRISADGPPSPNTGVETAPFGRRGLLLLMLLLVTACGGESSPTDQGDGGNGGTGAFTVSPDTVVAGGAFRIEGMSIDPSQVDTWHLRVGPEVAPFRSMPDGSIVALTPLFLESDSSSTSVPPSTPLDVVFERSGTVVARADGALTVRPLPNAPGTTLRMATDLAMVTESLDSLFSRLSGNDPRFDGARQATLGALRGIVAASDSSLRAVLDGSSSWLQGNPDVALSDAVLAACGAADYAAQLAAAFAPVRTKTPERIPGVLGGLCRGSGEDFELACLMQIYSLLDDYTQAFVSPTARTWGNTVGLAAGLIAVSGYAVPATVVIGAILATMDFLMSKVVPALLPSHVTQFELVINRSPIPVGSLTDTEIRISAANTPSTITVNDMVDVILADMGLAGESQLASSFSEVLLNAVQFVIDLYRTILREYNNLHPGTFNDLDFTTARLTWGPTLVEDADLVELFSFQPGIARPDEPAFEWLGVSPGTARIQGRGRAGGERAKVLRDHALCLGCVYSGGAWGNDAPATNTESQEVEGVLMEWAHTHAGGMTVTGTMTACSVEQWEVELSVAGVVGGGILSGSGFATFASDSTGFAQTVVPIAGTLSFPGEDGCSFDDDVSLRLQMNSDWTQAAVMVGSTGAGQAVCAGVPIPQFASVFPGEETQVSAQAQPCTAGP